MKLKRALGQLQGLSTATLKDVHVWDRDTSAGTSSKPWRGIESSLQPRGTGLALAKPFSLDPRAPQTASPLADAACGVEKAREGARDVEWGVQSVGLLPPEDPSCITLQRFTYTV